MAIKKVNLQDQSQDRSIRQRDMEVKEMGTQLADLSFQQLRDMVEYQSDNEFDSDQDFINAINLIFAQINGTVGQTLKFITYEEMTDILGNEAVTFCKQTNFPNELISVMIQGLIASIQYKEQENSALQDRKEFLGEIDRLFGVTEYKTRATGSYQAVVGDIDEW